MSETLTILAARFWPDAHGGIETHLRHFANQLAESGVAVQVLTENRTNSATIEQISDMLTIHREIGPTPDWRWRWWPSVQAAWWKRFIQRVAPQGPIWASNAILAAGAIRAGYGDRVIFNPAGCIGAMREIGRRYPRVTTMQCSWLLERMERVAYKRCPNVVVSSNNVRNQLREFYGPRENVHVLPLATEIPEATPDRDASRREWSIDPNAFVIGFVGRLDPCKDIDLLLHALASGQLAPSTRLLLVGDGPDRDRLRNLAEQRHVNDRVIWAGGMSDPRPAYAAMDTFVLPSVYEAFGMVLQEAMAAGVPVLGRRGNGRDVFTASDEIIEHGRHGFTFESHGADDLVSRLLQLEQDPALRRRLGAAAQADCRYRTWSIYVREAMSRLNLGETYGNSNEHTRRAA